MLEQLRRALSADQHTATDVQFLQFRREIANRVDGVVSQQRAVRQIKTSDFLAVG